MDLIFPEIADGEDKSSPFINCIRKNYKHIRKWAKRTQTNCFRIYDREINHYPLAIDYYDGHYCIHYYAPNSNTDEPPEDLKEEVETSIVKIFGTKPEEVYWKIRSRHKETRQYEKFGASQDFFVVVESGVKFWVNLQDYLDTGLFLDHRETRRLVASYAKDKEVLNLFAYTCSFSVQSAKAGATYTKSVDMSNTYTEWGKENFILNGFSLKNHEIVRADCLKFLGEERHKYDIIIIDPPTISRSKKMDQMFDIQKDYIYLIQESIRLLKPEGRIFFSTNSRRFLFDENLFPGMVISEISDKTLPIDFHDPKIHRCWRLEKRV